MSSARNKTTRLQNVLLGLYYNYAIFLGMSSYRYDFTAQTFAKTPLATRLALLANFVTVLLLPFSVWDTLRHVDAAENPILIAANSVDFVVRALAVLYTVLYRFRREPATWRVSNVIIKLNLSYISRLPCNNQIEHRIARLLYLKYGLMVYLGLSVMLNLFMTEMLHWHWYSYVLIFLLVQALWIVHVTTFGYFLALHFVYRSLCYLNARLRELQRRIRIPRPMDQRHRENEAFRRICEELRQLQAVHGLLAQCALQFSRIYRFQMLAVRFSGILSNVFMGYYGFVYVFYKNIPTLLRAYGAFTYFAMMLDLYVLDLTCDNMVKAYEETLHILRRSNELERCFDQWDKVCEQFALRCASSRLRVEVCGLFAVDKTLWFLMLTATCSYTLVLMQFHIVKNKEN